MDVVLSILPAIYRTLAFRRTVTLWDNFGSVLLAVPYCGMVLGIESDGYTHS